MNYHEIKADPTLLSDKHFSYATYTENLRPIKNTPWLRNHGSSLVDVHKQVGEDLVEDPGFPSMIFLPSEIRAAEMRAQCCENKTEDVVCTLVYQVHSRIIRNSSNVQQSTMVESVLYSQIQTRIDELYNSDFIVYITIIYSEDTHQVFWRNDQNLHTKPQMPKYDAKYERRRRAYRGAGL